MGRDLDEAEEEFIIREVDMELNNIRKNNIH